MPRIAYFGPSGTFTEMALAKLESTGAFDGPVERVPAPSQGAAVELVRAGKAAGAVVPIESSVEGSIAPTLDALAVGPRLQILAETDLDVAFTIVGRPGIALEEVRRIAAYPVAAAQVRMWLAVNMPRGGVEYPAATSAPGAAVVGGGGGLPAGGGDAAPPLGQGGGGGVAGGAAGGPRPPPPRPNRTAAA
ncbi:prephenate dehydratase domain-containing protein, partial [Nocardia tengchongensis]|uniref:prephenate dehydratase domain-containing protein n=1 Tax=Nocardia tengchongensis TaxID=2055889 RepID=UPI003678DD31